MRLRDHIPGRAALVFLLLFAQITPGGGLAYGAMARTRLSRGTVRAVERYGPSVESLAEHRYGIHGDQLLARLVSGESHDNPNAVSRAGARGRTQFMPGTRAVVLDRYGIDPWKNADQAVHAAALHLLGKLGNRKGLEGYNPGDPGYASYILSQRTNLGGQARKLGVSPGATGGRGASAVQSLSDLLGPAVIQQLGLDKPTPPPTSGPPAPAGSDARQYLHLPQVPGVGQGVPESSGGPAPKSGVQDLLAKVAELAPQGDGLSPVAMPGKAGGGAVGAAGQPLGKVTVAKGANLPGKPLHSDVVNFVRGVAGLVGHPLTIGTGTNHSRLTINGTVSDHARGQGADVPLTGRALIRAGQAALIEAGMSPAKARRITGGGFNLTLPNGRRVQVIFNTDAPGWGNHLGHLHVGFSG